MFEQETCNVIRIENKDHWLGLRMQDITSTEVSCLFGLSKYKTLFELWHEKKNGDIIAFDENERMKWGSRLEPVIAAGVAEDNGWTIEPMKRYYRHKEFAMGSSFDFFIVEEQAIFEIKNVDGLIYKNEWIDGEAPAHIELQVQHQLAVTGLKKAYICALVGGNQVELIPRTRDEAIIKLIFDKVAEFWKSIELNQPPVPNYEQDAEYIISLNQHAEPNKIYSGDIIELEQLAIKHAELGQAEKEIKSQRDGIKARCLEIIGDSEKVKSDLFTISAGVVGETIVESFAKKPYRNFRVFLKKEKVS